MATEHNTHEEYLQTNGVPVFATSCGFVAVICAIAYVIVFSVVFLLEIIEFLFKLLTLLASTMFYVLRFCDV